jgi:hypothetical protein
MERRMTDVTAEPNGKHEGNLRDVLMAIREKRGALTPAIVVEEAAAPDHPLHHRFEWDDTEAAIKYRLSQAQSLLRVKYKTDVGNKRGDLRAFWVTRDAQGELTSRYEPIEEVITDPFQRDLMLKQMRRDWQTFKKRYQHMEEFVAEIVSDLDDGTPQAG